MAFNCAEGNVVTIPRRALDDIPLYDEELQYLCIPDDDFDDLDTRRHYADKKLRQWSEKVDDVIGEMNSSAVAIDRMSRNCNITSVVSGSVGLAGGAAFIGGMILMPPVAVAGLIVGGVGAAGSATAGIVKIVDLKNRMKKLQPMLEDIGVLHDELQKAVRSFDEALLEIMRKNIEEMGPRSHHSSSDPGSKTLGKTAMEAAAVPAVTICSVAARLALKESAYISVSIAKTVAHATAVVGMIIDLVSVVWSSMDLAKGSKCELADKLRSAAAELKTERDTLMKIFIRQISLVPNYEQSSTLNLGD